VRRLFCISAGVILFATAIAKVYSAFGSANALLVHDPITGLSFGHLIMSAGFVEFIVAYICLPKRFENVAVRLVAWVSMCFVLYRFGLVFMGWRRPCPCLGNFTDAIHVLPHSADNIMKGVLGYLLIGSYGILFHQWWRNRKLAVGSSEIRNRKSELGIGS